MLQLGFLRTGLAGLEPTTPAPAGAVALLKAARRYNPGHGSPRPGHFRAFAISVPGRWRELHARGRKLHQSGVPPKEIPARLGITPQRWADIVAACSVRVVALPLDNPEPDASPPDEGWEDQR